MKREWIWMLVGAACLGWGGSSIAAGAATPTVRAINLFLFAMGIVMFAQVPVARLAARVRTLEAKSQV